MGLSCISSTSPSAARAASGVTRLRLAFDFCVYKRLNRPIYTRYCLFSDIISSYPYYNYGVFATGLTLSTEMTECVLFIALLLPVKNKMLFPVHLQKIIMGLHQAVKLFCVISSLSVLTVGNIKTVKEEKRIPKELQFQSK